MPTIGPKGPDSPSKRGNIPNQPNASTKKAEEIAASEFSNSYPQREPGKPLKLENVSHLGEEMLPKELIETKTTPEGLKQKTVTSPNKQCKTTTLFKADGTILFEIKNEILPNGDIRYTETIWKEGKAKETTVKTTKKADIKN
jgi:hypothetical protein